MSSDRILWTKKNIIEKFINNPSLEEIYKQTLKNKNKKNCNLDNVDLKKIIDDVVIKNEEKFKEEIVNKANENAKIKEKEYEENIEREREKARNEIQKLIDKKKIYKRALEI